MPGNGLSRRTVRALAERHYVIDFLERPKSTASILCDVCGFLGHEFANPGWPLVYSAATLPAGDLERVGRYLDSHPHAVDCQMGPEHQLKSIELGEMVASSPLLPSFLELMAERDVDDVLFAELIAETFAWDKV